MIDKIIQQIKKFLPFVFIVWLIVALFFAIDGISRNLYGMDINFFFKGLYNNRIVIFFPFLLAFFISLKDGKVSRLFNFAKKNSLIIFVSIVDIYYVTEAFTFDYYLFYIAKLLMSFIFFISVIFLLYKAEGILKRVFSGEESNQKLREEAEKIDSFSKKELIISFILAIVFLALRFCFLNGLYPTTDEYLHLLEAKSRLFPEGVLYSRNSYVRASFLTYIVERIFEYFGTNVVLGRIPGVIISCLTSLLFYLFVKKENKTFAVICSLLFVFSPWSIMLSRTIREYIFFLPVNFLLSIYIFRRVNTILDRKYKWYYLLPDFLITFLLGFYSFKIDPSGTMKFSVVFYLIGFIYWLLNSIQGKKISEWLKKVFFNWKILVAISVFMLISTLANKFLGFSFSIMQVNILPSLNLSWIGYIFFDQSYGSLIFFGIFLVTGVLSSLKYCRNSQIGRLQTFYVTALLVILYFFSFHFGRYYRPRYISLVLPSLIIMSASGFLFIKNLLVEQLGLKQKNLFILLLIFINWPFVFYGFLAKGDGYVKVTYEFSEGMELVYDYLKDKDDGYVLVTSLPEAADWYWDDGILKIFQFSYSDPDREKHLDKIVSMYRKGYFVIDERRNEWGGYTFEENQWYITKSGYIIKYVKTIDYYMIFEWSR